MKDPCDYPKCGCQHDGPGGAFRCRGMNPSSGPKTRPATNAEVRKAGIALLDRIAGRVLAHKPPAKTKKAKKRQRARRKVQRESSI